MPVASTGVYEVVLRQTYQTQPMVNVFHYIEDAGQENLQDELGVAWEASIVPALATIQNDTLKYTDVKVFNLSGGQAEATITPSLAQGGVTGLDMAGYIAAPYRYNRLETTTRNGAKRFAGMVEENVQTDVPTAGYFTIMQSIEAILNNDFTTATGLFVNVILRKPANPGPTWNYSNVQSVRALNRITTQNSRKRW